MIWFRRLHKWIGLAIGLQIAVWMISGLMMGLLEHAKVQGLEHRASVPTSTLPGAASDVLEPSRVLPPPGGTERVNAIELVTLLDQTLYRVATSDGVQLFDATSGELFVVQQETAADVARRDYAGPGSVTSVSRVQAPMMEVRKHEGPAWRVDFDDDANTSIYVSAGDGAVLERRNDTWRLFDIFWMLHIMDYAEREDFNNALVILVGLIAAFFSVTGMVLLIDSFTKEDLLGFLPAAWWRRTTQLTVCGPTGEVVSRFDTYSGDRLYDALARSGIALPSNCGGGGTCGLCEVTLDPDAPLTAADQRLIPAARRARGGRLSCQAKVVANGTVAISRESLDAEIRTAIVSAVRCVTPFIREITLDLGDDEFDYRAGSYVHVVIPPHRLALDTLDVPADVLDAWGANRSHLHSHTDSEVRRAYSLATAAPDNPGQLVLNVRLMLPDDTVADLPAGAGSTYMWSLRPGDEIELAAPFGEFHADASTADLIAIGGGAGMAPLRAIIRDQLIYCKSGRRIEFWYGARSRADLLYRDELDELQETYSNFRWQPVLSAPDPSDAWDGPVGFVHATAHETVLRHHPDVASCEYFLCGPPAMLAATRRILADLDVSEERIQFDDFGI